MITGILLGKALLSIRAGVVFYLLYLFAVYGIPKIGGVAGTSLLAWFALVFKCYPCCMTARIIIATTTISEFMAGMSKLRCPKAIVIPLAIMFRYFPVVIEDWSHIRDAMALRGLKITPVGFIKAPSAVIDALYVPMLVSASKASDELSAAAVSRGIEDPAPRTCRLKISFGISDPVFAAVYIAAFIAGLAG